MPELRVEVEPLRKRCLFLATPAYGGNINMCFSHSMLRLQKLLVDCAIPHMCVNMGNESLITRARNGLTAQFLATDSTDLMFIDSDIEFEAQDVVALMHFNRPVIGASYPMKNIRWDMIKKAVLKHPDIAPEDLEKMGAHWTAHFFEGRIDVFPFEPVKVQEVATGFTMIKREVFDTLKPFVPEYDRAPNEPTSIPEFVSDYFQAGTHDRRYESEDYNFSRLWREHGGDIWLCPWMKLNHQGTYSFKGDLNKYIELLGEVN